MRRISASKLVRFVFDPEIESYLFYNNPTSPYEKLVNYRLAKRYCRKRRESFNVL